MQIDATRPKLDNLFVVGVNACDLVTKICKASCSWKADIARADDGDSFGSAQPVVSDRHHDISSVTHSVMYAENSSSTYGDVKMNYVSSEKVFAVFTSRSLEWCRRFTCETYSLVHEKTSNQYHIHQIRHSTSQYRGAGHDRRPRTHRMRQ